MMMNLLGICIPLLLFLQADLIDPSQSDTPYISAQLAQLDGSQIAIRYRAARWDPQIIEILKQDQSALDFFNENILSQAVAIQSNVQLGIGRERLNPGIYQIGIWLDPPTAPTDPAVDPQAAQQAPPDFNFSLVGYRDELELFRLPVRISSQAQPSSHLSIIFTPGITDRDFLMTAIIGNYILPLKWRFTGIPAITDEEPEIANSLPFNERSTDPFADESSTDADSLIPLKFKSPFVSPAGLPSVIDNTRGIEFYRQLDKILQDARKALNTNSPSQVEAQPKKDAAGSGAFRELNSGTVEETGSPQ